jgi:hypothetical protein
MITALGPRLGLGLRLDFGSQVWFVQYFSEKKVIVSPAGRGCGGWALTSEGFDSVQSGL